MKLVFLSLSLALAWTEAQLIGDELTFQVTYRDFLPSGCFYGIDGRGDLVDFQQDAWDLNFPPGNVNSCDLFSQNGNSAQRQIWQEAISSGAVRGHPDFEANDQIKVSTLCAVAKPESGNLDFPAGFCAGDGQEDVPMTKRTMETLTNGLQAPAYCSDGPQDRCGRVVNGGFTHTRKELFDQWYKDDLSLNRRIGQKLTLKRADGNIFSFSSNNNNDNDAPEFGSDQTPKFFGPLDRFNGLSTIVAADEIINLEAWPQSDPDTFTDSNILNRKFWFTTELHTTFEFSRNAEMTFTFSGDDDFWAYVNGQLIIDLGGNHAALSATVNLNEVGDNGFSVAGFLGLQEGQVYTLDIFHAERKFSGSNFEIQTSLLAACNVQQSGSVQFDFSDEILVDEFTTKGIELGSGSEFKLTNGQKPFQSNHIFTSDIQNLEKGFVCSFEVSTDGTPVEGFAFVVQNEGVDDLPSQSSGFNFNFLRSIAVVFDFTGDEKEVRVHFPNNPNERNSVLKEDTRRVFDKVLLRQLERGESLPVEIIYFGGKPDFLEVYIAGSLFLRQSNFKIEDRLGGTGGHIGFTASTSEKVGDITIDKLKFTGVDVDPKGTVPLFQIVEEPEEILADGETLSTGSSFQTRDLCGTDISTGGLTDEFTAFFVEDIVNGTYFNGSLVPNVEDAVVVDNVDGSYSLKLATLSPGTYSLFLSFGKSSDCRVSIQENPSNPSEVFIPRIDLEGDDCFITSIREVVTALELDINATGDPVVLDDNEEEVPVLVIALTAGSLLVLAIIGGLFFAGYWRKWQREKNFVKKGAAFRREQNTQFAGGQEYKSAGKQLLEQQQEILELRAKGGQHDREKDIQSLKQENFEMKEMLKNAKKENTLGVVEEQAAEKGEMTKRKKHGKVDF